MYDIIKMIYNKSCSAMVLVEIRKVVRLENLWKKLSSEALISAGVGRELAGRNRYA